jgi:hypothetical protein
MAQACAYMLPPSERVAAQSHVLELDVIGLVSP